MEIVFDVLQIIFGIFVVGLILLQTKGSTFSGAAGNAGSIFRSRRGVELLLFQLTIGFGVSFLIISFVSAVIFRNTV